MTSKTTLAFVAGFLAGIIVGFVSAAKAFACRVAQAREERETALQRRQYR